MTDHFAPEAVEPRAALVPAAELQRRIVRLKEVMREQDIDAALLQQNAALY